MADNTAEEKDALQYALDVAICGLQETVEDAARDGLAKYESHAYKTIDVITIVLTGDQQQHSEVVEAAGQRVDRR